MVDDAESASSMKEDVVRENSVWMTPCDRSLIAMPFEI